VQWYGIVKGKMSTSPYSNDLRKKVITYLSKGKTQKEASEVFEVHRNTVSRWNKRYRQEGTYAARQRLGYKSKLDHNKIELFVKDNPDTKVSSISAHFGISKGHAGSILKKVGFSYKKKPLPTWKQRKTSV
jgi:transposase